MPDQTKPYRDQATGPAHELKEKATHQFDKLADKATGTFRDVADQAEHFASRVTEQGREASEKVEEVAGNLKGAVDKSLKDQPLTTLAMAAVLGFILGALWKK
jgi:ElaB/YqjD/DUF883 family membrane-anchored ribosome-binding protein